MVEMTAEKNAYAEAFEIIEAQAGPSWLLPIRKAAMARFADLGIPTTRHEEWKFTNVAPIRKLDFALAEVGGHGVTPDRIAPFVCDGATGGTFVFVNGHFDKGLSKTGQLPAGITVGSVAEAVSANAGLLEQHLARHATNEQDAFLALNTALMRDGLFVHVPKGLVVEQPIQAVFVTTSESDPTMAFSRNLIVADESSQVTVVEVHVGLGTIPFLASSVTEIVVGDNATVDHYRVTREGELPDNGFFVGTTHAQQGRDCNMRSFVATTGGAIVRNDATAWLGGEGSDFTINGLTMIEGRQLADNHLCIDHAVPHCTSWEYFKGVYDDDARGVFSGRINVHKDAQKTDAKQTNMSLLLSDRALVDSKPQLEIFADDVKCTHGATIGQLDDEALFYLRSRGMMREAARSLLVFGFCRESLQEIRFTPLKKQLEALVFERLPHGNVFLED